MTIKNPVMNSAEFDDTSHSHILGDVTGVSMQPTLYEGDTVIVDVRIRNPRRGDVVALKSVVHRFVWLDPFGGIWHSGDFMLNVSRAPASSFQGVVKSVIRNGEVLDIPRENISNWDCSMRVLKGVHFELQDRYRKLCGYFSLKDNG
jgi:signal peptidase I